MPSRYDRRMVAVNDSPEYQDTFRKKGIKFVRQYDTPVLRYPTSDEINQLETIAYTWTVGSKFYKLAFEYYGDSSLWWVIAYYNQTPTEAHVSDGDTIFIPLPLDKILEFFDI